MGRCRHLLASLTVSALLLAAAWVLAPAARAASGYTDHAPILIEGNAGFTAVNGVVAGNGTAADPYRIEGWSIDASTTDGIVIRNTTASFLVHDVIVFSGGYSYNGMVLDNVTNGLVQNTTLTHDASGLVVRRSSNLTLFANAFILNAWNGVDLAGSRNIFLNGNSASYNRDGFSFQNSEGIRFAGNTVWLNTQDGMYLVGLTNVSVIGGVVSSNSWSGLDIQTGSNISATANQLSSNGRLGIFVTGVNGLRLGSNALASNPGGSIQVNGATNVTLDGNTVSPAGASGVVVESVQGAVITRNAVATANYSGILLNRVSDVTLRQNTLLNNDVGVGGVNVTNLVMTSNQVSTSVEHGVSLVGSLNLTLTRNNVSRNGDGIVLESDVGASLRENLLWQNGYGVILSRSTGIAVVNNSFLQNGPQANDDGTGGNAWDAGYPAGGNYWSDYAGVDLCSGPNQTVCISPDGLGDTPYYVGFGEDHYPLMRIPGSSPKFPVATFVVSPFEGNTSTVFLFDASSSYDLEDPAAALLVRWDLNGDGTWDTPWTTNRTLSYQYAEPGEYAVRLEVLDLSGLMSTKVQVVHVAALPPSPPSLLEQIVPWAIVLGVLGAVLFVTVYPRIQLRRARVGKPAWRLRPRPPR